MLKQRIITALIMLPIALGGFFLLQGGWCAHSQAPTHTTAAEQRKPTC